jgi:hypothetical protein
MGDTWAALDALAHVDVLSPSFVLVAAAERAYEGAQSAPAQ